jgi:hydrogenase expression/formation protein HypC
MCIAVPGKVLTSDGVMGLVDFSGNQIEVDLRLVEPKIGDYVLVHAGCAIQIVRKEYAEDLAALLAEIEALSK